MKKLLIMALLLKIISSYVFSNNGCTDPIAFNYDVNATNDDGSCIIRSGYYDSNLLGEWKLSTEIFFDDLLQTYIDSSNNYQVS